MTKLLPPNHPLFTEAALNEGMKRTLTPGRPKRWIVVDDNAALGEAIYICLGQLGLASVEWYTSGADALDAMAHSQGDVELLVTDRDMPGVCGLELTRRLREGLPALKVIVVTANHNDLTTATMRETGAFAILPKPFSLDRLETAVRAAVCELHLEKDLHASDCHAYAA